MLPLHIKVPDEFLKEEIRDGYYVDKKHKQIWAVHLDLFKAFSDLCNQFDIKFQVAFGTLIGAVRHKGFIPWDDDFDVWMDRENYQKLMKIRPEDVPEPYFLQTPLSDRKFFIGLTRFRNSMTTAAIRGLCSPDYNSGIYLDIYVMDGLNEATLQRKWQWLLKMIVVKLIQLHYQKGPRTCRVFDLCCYCLKPISLLLGYERLIEMYDRVLMMREATSDCLSYLLTGLWKPKGYWITKEEIKDTIMMPFENTYVPAPRDYDIILKRIYGEYKKFPSEEERGKWHEGQIHFEPDVPYVEYLSKLANDAE